MTTSRTIFNEFLSIFFHGQMKFNCNNNYYGILGAIKMPLTFRTISESCLWKKLKFKQPICSTDIKVNIYIWLSHFSVCSFTYCFCGRCFFASFLFFYSFSKNLFHCLNAVIRAHYTKHRLCENYWSAYADYVYNMVKSRSKGRNKTKSYESTAEYCDERKQRTKKSFGAATDDRCLWYTTAYCAYTYRLNLTLTLAATLSLFLASFFSSVFLSFSRIGGLFSHFVLL